MGLFELPINLRYVTHAPCALLFVFLLPYYTSSSPPSHGGEHAACIFYDILCGSSVGRSNVVDGHWQSVGGLETLPMNLVTGTAALVDSTPVEATTWARCHRSGSRRGESRQGRKQEFRRCEFGRHDVLRHKVGRSKVGKCEIGRQEVGCLRQVPCWCGSRHRSESGRQGESCRSDSRWSDSRRSDSHQSGSHC